MVGSSACFLLDGDTKYLLSEIFAAAPRPLTTSTEMLKKGWGVLPCLHSALGFAKMTQKLLGCVALPWSAPHRQHSDGLTPGFTGRCPGVASGLLVSDPYQTLGEQLSLSQVQMQSSYSTHQTNPVAAEQFRPCISGTTELPEGMC